MKNIFNLLDIKNVIGILGGIVFVITLIGFLFKGPKRWIKISVLILIILFAIYLLINMGIQGFFIITTILLSTVAINMIGMLTWKDFIKEELEPAGLDDCPKHGLRLMEKWSNGLVAMGFSHSCCSLKYWEVLGTERETWIRFLYNPQEYMWAEIHICANPKMAARLIASELENDKSIITVDQVANQEFFEDNNIFVQRIASKSNIEEMVKKHLRLVADKKGAPKEVSNPVEMHIHCHDSWVERLLNSRQVIKRDDTIAIPFRKLFAKIPQIYSNWLQ